jgi:hypothetical protein
LVLNGEVQMVDPVRGTLLGHGRLGPHEAAALAQAAFPAGFDFDGLELAFEGAELRGRLGQVVASRWTSGPFSADHVSFAVDHFSAAPGLLVPSLELHAVGLYAARLEALDWRLESLWIPFAAGDLGKKLVIDATGWAAAWVTPDGDVGPVDLVATSELKLTGGLIAAQVDSRHGLIEALGTLKSSPLTKRTSFSADIAFLDAGGPLAAALGHDLEQPQRAAFGERLSGRATLEVDVDREHRFAPWVTEVTWVDGRLDAPGATAPSGGGGALAWDGYAWAPPSEPESARPDAEDP